MREKPAFSLPGGPMFLLLIVAVAATVFVLISSAQMQATVGIVVAMFALFVEVICFKGLLIVNPNEGQVLQLFGTYVGTLRDQGWRWVNPFTTRRRISSARAKFRNVEAESERSRWQSHRNRGGGCLAGGGHGGSGLPGGQL